MLPDPLEVAKDWEDEGAPMVHVIDLDAALERGNNVQVIRGC